MKQIKKGLILLVVCLLAVIIVPFTACIDYNEGYPVDDLTAEQVYEIKQVYFNTYGKGLNKKEIQNVKVEKCYGTYKDLYLLLISFDPSVYSYPAGIMFLYLDDVYFGGRGGGSDICVYTADKKIATLERAYENGTITHDDLPGVYEVIWGEKYDSGEGFENDLQAPEGLTIEQTADIVRAFFEKYTRSFIEKKEIRRISVDHFLGTYSGNKVAVIKVKEKQSRVWVYEEYSSDDFIKLDRGTVIFIYKPDGTGEGFREAYDNGTITEEDKAQIIETAKEIGICKE